MFISRQAAAAFVSCPRVYERGDITIWLVSPSMGLFTATRLQVATYLLVVCPFSIAFLVYLNSSVSFVITDLIGQDKGVGDAVGTLGFADELLALVACPIWGLISDRVGVRLVCFAGYMIIGLALFIFVQAKHVYPDLLLGRLLFSLGGSAASTMVTAVLPTMSFTAPEDGDGHVAARRRVNGHGHNPSVASEQTITPSNYCATMTSQPRTQHQPSREQPDSTSKIAGFVGMATGCGALVALSIFLPLPARFQKYGVDPARALQYSYYIVAVIALALGVFCSIGLRGLRSERKKGWQYLLRGGRSEFEPGSIGATIRSTAKLLHRALLVGFTRKDIFIGYIGGFVARASSVGVSLFVPLLVNAAFLSSGLCTPEQSAEDPSGLPDIKRRCPRAYVVAAELTGASQLVALLCAPLFGYWSSRISSKSVPLMFAAATGIIGYPLFAARFDPHDDNTRARVVAFLAVCCIGISQIGAIVCSLGILSRGVIQQPDGQNDGSARSDTETEPLIDPEPHQGSTTRPSNLGDLKGSIAGVYSFYGGAGILILTKAGGALFDKTTTAAPFYMMACFNAVLLIVCLAVSYGKN